MSFICTVGSESGSAEKRISERVMVRFLVFRRLESLLEFGGVLNMGYVGRSHRLLVFYRGKRVSDRFKSVLNFHFKAAANNEK